MPLISAPKKHAPMATIYLTFFILLSIPIILFGLAQDDFDTRKEAFQDLELNEENPCLISLPHVNPYSLESGRTVTIQVDAKLKDEGISAVEISNSQGEIVHQEDFDNSPIEIATSFLFTPEMSGEVDLSGILKKAEGGSVACQITSPYDIQGLQVIPNNSAPEFTSNPSESIPSQNISTKERYEYTLIATDTEKDRINYSYSFTPRADWLKPTIIEDGSGGKLTIKFSGETDKPASYLANIFIHDGYSKNLKSQSWVINVSPSENDIPVVTFTNPAKSLRVDKGTTFKTAWEATDLNHILDYELYITNNPANEESWITLQKNIPYDTSSYNIDTTSLDSGTYKVIAKATDNQKPPAVGKGVSPEIVISATSDLQPESDDSVIITQPQVVNMSPLSTEDIANKRTTVRATIIASKGAQVQEDSILFKLDEKDITEEIKINRISEQEYTLIYQPEKDLDPGLHKAETTFSDSQNLEATKSWTFTIQQEDQTSEDIYTIFGYKIAKNIVHIVGIGILTVILALVTPFIIFSIWKDDKKRKNDSDEYVNSKLPPSIPSDTTQYYIQPDVESSSLVGERIEPKDKEEENKEDAWDRYSAPSPTEVIETQESLPEQPTVVETSKFESKQQKEEVSTPIPQTHTQQASPAEVETPPLETAPASSPATIPEPEIPEISELENLSLQLKKIKEQEKKEEQSPAENK